jgi:hypothetical protein
MKLAYLVVSHRNPGQVLRLVGALSESPSAIVAVRHDQRRSRLDGGAVESAGGRLLEDELEVEWGGWSHLRMLLGALERVAAEHDPDWVLVLSRQDYPLGPLALVEERLAATSENAFLGLARPLDTDRRPPPPRDEFFLRYAYFHLRTPGRPPYLPRRLRPLAYTRERPPRLGIRRPRLPFGEGLRCWVSSDWPTLDRAALEAVLRALRDRRDLVRHYRRTVSPAESFFATVLMNHPDIDVSHDDRRFVRFAPGAPNPDVLSTADFDELKASGADFARKFDADADGRVLDLLDELRNSPSPR